MHLERSLPRVFGCLSPVVVGCGVRLGHQSAATSLNNESASSMPIPNCEQEAVTCCSWVRTDSRMSSLCPALGICPDVGAHLGKRGRSVGEDSLDLFRNRLQILIEDKVARVKPDELGLW